MRKKLTKSIALFGLPFMLAGCSNPVDDPTDNPEVVDPISISPVIEKLRNGFKLTGTFKIDENYFTDKTFQVPDTTVSPSSSEYYFVINFENSETYEGVDRRYYTITDAGGERVQRYYFGENSFNKDGYAALNYLDYSNEVVTDYAYDENGGFIPYATNGLLNPFKYLQRNDFIQTKDGFVLSTAKTNVLVTSLCSQLDGYQANIDFDTRLFDFTEDNLTKATFVSSNYDSREYHTVPNAEDKYHQAFVRTNYSLDLEFSELGAGKAKELIAPMPEKEENIPLQKALDNMVAAQNYTLTRRVTPYINGAYVGYDSCLSIYHMGKENGVYSQSYNLEEGQALPAEPTASDYILRYRNSSSQVMSIYQVNASTGEFSLNGAGYGSINNVFAYEDLLLPLEGVDADTFIYNEEDGSYSPTDDNLPYITRELFMSTVDSFTPVDYGYVTSFKLYLNEAKDAIDHIDTTYEDHVGYSGTFNITISDVGNSKPAFELKFAN